MRKQKSIRWFRYTVEDAKAAQAELDEQAERGWELEEVGLFTATFRRAERPRRCWVEPARWKSERKKDWDARSDYLTLCGEAGWELLEEDGGLFYFRAKEGGDPAPVQTDKDMEWNYVWKKALADQVWSLSYLAVYWSIWTVGGYIREHPRMWELFLSNISMAMATLVLLWLGMDLFFVVRVLRYRAKCRPGSTPACGSCSCPISPWPWRPLCCCGWEWICFSWCGCSATGQNAAGWSQRGSLFPYHGGGEPDSGGYAR